MVGFSIPNCGICGELSSDFANDTFCNGEVIGRALKSKKAGKAIAETIAVVEMK